MKQYDVVVNRTTIMQDSIRVVVGDEASAAHAESVARKVADNRDDAEWANEGECITAYIQTVAVVPTAPGDYEFKCPLCGMIRPTDDSHRLPSDKLICVECYGERT